MRLAIATLCGPYCVNPVDGGRVYAEALAALKRGEAVCFDFTSVKVLLSVFATNAVGRLYGDFAAADLETRLSFEGLDAVDEELLHEVLAKARRFYAASPEVRARLIEGEKQLVTDQ